MNFKELLLCRQSDRKYEDKTVEKEKLEACLEAARLSPSACNSQYIHRYYQLTAQFYWNS